MRRPPGLAPAGHCHPQVWNGTCGLTELLQGVHGVLHVDPEAELPQRDLVVGHSEGQLSGGAVDDLTEG